MASKSEFEEFTIGLIDDISEFFRIPNPLDTDEIDGNQITKNRTKEEYKELITDLYNQACDLFGVDSPLEDKEDESEEEG